MSRRLIIALVLVGVICGAVAAVHFLPKRYETGESLIEATIFWHDKEAFVFLDVNRVGRATNALQDRVARRGDLYLMILLGMGQRFSDNRVLAYRLQPSGKLEQLPLPFGSSVIGTWSLHEGELQLAPPAARNVNAKGYVGFRWDRARFVAVAAEKASARSTTDAIESDDAMDDGEADFLTTPARREFKSAGWHWKALNGYEIKGLQGTLPIALGKDAFSLTVTKFPPRTENNRFDALAYGVKNLELAQAGSGREAQTLWEQKGWQQVSKSEFERLERESGRSVALPFSMTLFWITAFFFIIFWRFGALGHLFVTLFTAKRRVLKNIGTSYSFPPAVPGQFPKLDTERLDYYTREFEGMGFTRLGDFSLVSDSAKPIPSFCRLFVNTKHHCFGAAFQIFPAGKSPRELKCAISSSLEEGWDLNFGDRKPVAANSLVRRPRGISVSMPEATLHELLNAFLQMRAQVCQELGISPLKDDTLEGYIAKLQASQRDIRESVRRRSFATGIPQVYWRKFSLLKTKQEYVWLGDYPKEAERRKQGTVMRAPAM